MARDSFDNSLISSPSIDENKKRVSLAPRQNLKNDLQSFHKTDDNQFVENVKEVEPQEFSVVLNSLHEINSKSFNPNKAFAYNFINEMDSIIDKEKLDFKMVAMSLDAGTRIYISKVDLVYNNTQKISSSLSMATEDAQNYSINDEEIELEDDIRPNIAKRKKKKHRKHINTIATNIESLNGKTETNIEIDPLFHHLSAAFDVGNVNSLLLANLQPNPNGALLLDSNASLDFSKTPNLRSKSINFSFPKSEYLYRTSDHICQFYSDFEFLRRDIDIDTSEIVISQQKTETDVTLNYDFDINTCGEDVNDQVDYDFIDQFNDLNALDLDYHADRPESSEINMIDMEADDNILKILPDMNEQPNLFFNRNFLKRAFQHVTRCRPSKVIKTIKKKRRGFIENNFSIKDIDLDNFEPSDTLFSKRTISNWSVNAKDKKIEDFHIDCKQVSLRSCLTRKNDFVGLNLKKSKILNQDLMRNENKENCDENSFSIDDEGVRHDDFDTSNIEPNSLQPLETDTQKQPLFEEQLIHVDALDIDYAKVAKKIDIKKVKTGMWDIIKTECTNELDCELEANSDSLKNVTFTNLKKNLPNRISSALNENLSTPISFVALLHLCNEKNLALKPTTNLTDFFIEAPQF